MPIAVSCLVYSITRPPPSIFTAETRASCRKRPAFRIALQRVEVALDRALVAARGGPGDGVGRREVTKVVDRASEQRRHALARGLGGEPSLDGQCDRFRQQRRWVIRSEDRGGMVEGEIDSAQVEGMTMEIACHLHQLVAQGRVGIDAEVAVRDILGRLGTPPKGLQ